MLILDSPSRDPHFNIAAEEYLLKETDEDYAFFYINQPSIIVGKHQNAWAEINLPWTRENNIPVVRRISGGGTVWHDGGNLNFSFILNGEEGKLVNFREYASPVLEFLHSLEIPAEFGKRNEMLVRGLKISGNAEHVYRRRVLHHGTLLFSSELSRLKRSLETDPEEYSDKAVQSVRSKTGNIKDFLVKDLEIAEFRSRLLQYVSESFKGAKPHLFSDNEMKRIEILIAEKYSLWKWNIGYSPRYSLKRDMDVDTVNIHAELHVEKGQIKSCTLRGTVPPGKLLAGDQGSLSDLAMQLTGMDHDPDALSKLIRDRNLVKPEWIDIFAEGLF